MKKIKTWWLLSIAGIIFIAIGIFAFLSPMSAYVKLVKWSGICLLLNGLILQVASYVHTDLIRERRWMLAECVVDFIFGVLLVFNPLFSFIVFPYLIGHWILCIGILKIIASLFLKKDIRGWGYILVLGMIACIFGLLIIFVPYIRVDGSTILLGSFALMIGVLTLFDSYRFRNRANTLNMVF